MTFGLFQRQAAIGLDIPKWVTVFVTETTQDLEEGFLKELIEGIATIGCRGATLVLANAHLAASSLGNAAFVDGIRDRIYNIRPYFGLVSCDSVFFEANSPQLAAGRGLVVHRGAVSHVAIGERRAYEHRLGPVPEAVVGGGCVLLDLRTTLLGNTTSPAELLSEVYSAEGLDFPFSLPQWRWGLDSRRLRTACILMALNMLAKPVRFAPNTFHFVADYLDEITSLAFNDRGLRPRWQEITA